MNKQNTSNGTLLNKQHHVDMNIENFKQFAKGTKASVLKQTNLAVIYTRVSTKEQAESNYSLDTQLKACTDYCQKKGYTIERLFGGTYESAKSDERKEFNNMLNFIKKHRHKISTIVVCYPDRFSRTGENAIYISKNLRDEGVNVESVFHNTDTTTQSGRLMQNFQFMMSSYDNQLRKERSITGMVAKLRRGYWMANPPKGYKFYRGELNQGEEQRLEFDASAPFIKKAFMLKLDGYSNIDIIRKLKSLGFSINKQTLAEILKNPFYCGVITHSLLESEVVQGRHQPLIDQKTFFRVNNILQKQPKKSAHKSENEHLPLRNMVKCNTCGKPLTGYLVKAKGLYYYKCNSVGCGMNKSAKHLNEKLQNELNALTVQSNLKDQLRLELLKVLESKSEDHKDTIKLLKTKLTELTTNLEAIEERFVLGAIDRPMYDKFHKRYSEEINTCRIELEKYTPNLGDQSKLIELAIQLSENLGETWAKGDFNERQKLQNLVFPEGFAYDKKNDAYRTNRLHSIIAFNARVSRDSSKNDKGQTDIKTDLSCLVEPNQNRTNQIYIYFAN